MEHENTEELVRKVFGRIKSRQRSVYDLTRALNKHLSQELQFGNPLNESERIKLYRWRDERSIPTGDYLLAFQKIHKEF